MRVVYPAGRPRTGRNDPWNSLATNDPHETTALTAAPLEQAELERLLEVGRRLVAQLELEHVLEDVLDAARDLCRARYAALGILDEEKLELERFVFAGVDESTRRRIGPLPRGHGILGELIRDPRPLRLDRISDHPRSYGFPAEHPPMTTFMGAPVMIRGEVFGNLYLAEKHGGERFTRRDERLLVVLAEWAAIAIDNARSHESTERRRRELERAVRGLQETVDLGRQIGGQATLSRIFELVAKRARALIEARVCLVLLGDGPSLQIADAAGEVPVDITESTVSHRAVSAALRTGSPQRLGEQASAEVAAALGFSARAALLTPLRSRGLELGALIAFDPLLAGESFDHDDELLLESFAAAAANGIAAAQTREDERLRLSMQASERERQRWARELHDETLQELGALRVAQDRVLQTPIPEQTRSELERASEQLRGVIDGLQGLITELRPAALDQLGTGPALEALVTRIGMRSELDVELDMDLVPEQGAEPLRYVAELESTLYRVVQEALNNVVKHAAASRVRVAVEERDESILVTVLDDGIGVDSKSFETDGFGLVGMRERVTLLGGEIAIRPEPGGGTRVTARLPISRRATATG